MNTAHRIADSFRSIVSYWSATPIVSNFLSKGTLTPAEFVDAGDQLAFKFPTWQWESTDSRRKVPWLPDNKQYLITRNVPCRLRVADLDTSLELRRGTERDSEWVIPGNDDEPHAADIQEIDFISSSWENAGRPSALAAGSWRGPTNDESSDASPSTDNAGAAAKGYDVIPQQEDIGPQGQPGGLRRSHEEEPHNENLSCADSQRRSQTEVDHQGGTGPQSSRLCGASSDDDGALDISSFQDVDDLLVEDDKSTLEYRDLAYVTNSDSAAAEDTEIVKVRSYDLSITYDKYYQTPRVWLFGYDENGMPLTSDLVVQDIMSDYVSKTITIDPHPCTGVPTVSIHPCKHAAVMQKVVASWIAANIEPRHDLALFVLLKFIASVVPTIEYDFTMDVEMFTLPH